MRHRGKYGDFTLPSLGRLIWLNMSMQVCVFWNCEEKDGRFSKAGGVGCRMSSGETKTNIRRSVVRIDLSSTKDKQVGAEMPSTEAKNPWIKSSVIRNLEDSF
jgi:hypothetical protein